MPIAWPYSQICIRDANFGEFDVEELFPGYSELDPGSCAGDPRPALKLPVMLLYGGVTAVHPRCRANAGRHIHWSMWSFGGWSPICPGPQHCQWPAVSRDHRGCWVLRLSSQQPSIVPRSRSIFFSSGKTTQPRFHASNSSILFYSHRDKPRILPHI